MKFFPKLNVYKDYSGNNTFNPTEMKATSYNWWVYFKRINGRNVFNDYRYSVMTAKHQRNMRSLLEELGIQIHIIVQIPGGLQKFDTIKEIREADKRYKELKKIEEDKKRIERNKRAREKRLKNKIIEQFNMEGIGLVYRNVWEFGKSESGPHTIGIHRVINDLKNDDEVHGLLVDAIKDNFPRVFIYN